jgi:hypothetical protein
MIIHEARADPPFDLPSIEAAQDASLAQEPTATQETNH